MRLPVNEVSGKGKVGIIHSYLWVMLGLARLKWATRLWGRNSYLHSPFRDTRGLLREDWGSGSVFSQRVRVKS